MLNGLGKCIYVFACRSYLSDKTAQAIDKKLLINLYIYLHATFEILNE